MKKLICILSLFFSALFFNFSCTNKVGSGSGAIKSPPGTTIIETGELAAVYSKSFVLPRFGQYWYQMRVIGILEHGTLVNPGDSIIQLEPTEIQKVIINRETDLENQLATLEKLYVDQENRINDFEARIKNEISAFDLKKIELDASQFDTEVARKIKQLEFEQAKIRLEKEKKKLELAKIVNQNELKIQEIRVRQVRTEIENAYNILPALTIRTPISGVFQIGINWSTGNLIKLGDNIYTGNNMANVPDLSQMKVNAFINETDFLKIRLGQKVAVRLDALPKVVFDAEVAYIGKLCRLKEPKSKQKGFDVEVNILKADERLKPGMTVSCEFIK